MTTTALDTPAPREPNRILQRWWSVITRALVAAIFLEAIFAGALLSGVPWARTAHAATAPLLIAAAALAGLVSLVALRHVAHGRKLGVTLLSLALVLILQAVMGALSAKGA